MISLSAICLTYGRLTHLQEAVGMFLAQDYQGPRELIVLNTFPGQKLVGDFPNVKIINCPERPKTLGDCRNLAIEAASGTHIVTWDDDDCYLPQHLSTFAKHFKDNEWVWLSRQFFAERYTIKGIVQGSANVVGFTKKAWELAGRYEPMGCGEDRNFVGRLTTNTKGEKVDIAAEEIGFIYSWGNGVYHVSGLGDDRRGMRPSYDRARVDLERRVKLKQVPLGEIKLQPRVSHDYQTQAREFLSQSGRTGLNTKDVCVVLLGRYGDIINSLPMLHHIHNTYGKPKLMVSQEFASLLEGVSYVEPYPVEFDNAQLGRGIELARQHFRHVVQAQVWGTNYKCERRCRSYNEESWRVAGFGHRFNDNSMFPVFDRRNLSREESLYNKVRRSDKPMLLVQVKNSASSPFSKGTELHDAIVGRFSDVYDVIDLTEVRAERIYDLLGLMDRAAALVSIDTALLHLSGASTIPVVALANPNPWLGSFARSNVATRLDYNSVLNNFQLVHDAIVSAVNHTVPPRNPIAVTGAPKRRIYHVVERHDEAKTDPRKLTAWQSWDSLYERGVIPVHVWDYPRTAKHVCGDPRPLPFLKDVLRVALDQAGEHDIIVWTNDDNWLHPQLADLLIFHVSIYGAVTSHRCEFKPGHPFNPKLSPEMFAKTGKPHMGRDLFAFTKEWLSRKWDELPDFILGASEFDLALACMVRVEKGIQSTRQNLEQVLWPAELPKGYVMHTMHKAHWSHPRNINGAPSQVHNRRLFREWSEKHLPALKFHPGNVI